MTKIIELGTVSSRGQIAIPSKIRGELKLDEGEKVIFILNENTLIIKKAMTDKTWEEITHPIREAVKKSNLKEEDVVKLVHKLRKNKRGK